MAQQVLGLTDLCRAKQMSLWKDGRKECKGTPNGKPPEHQNVVLTPSLPQPVKCPGWKVHNDMPANSILSHPITNLLSVLCILMQSFHMLMQKRKQKGLSVSSFTLLLVIFKWHNGRERVREGWTFGEGLICVEEVWIELSTTLDRGA